MVLTLRNIFLVLLLFSGIIPWFLDLKTLPRNDEAIYMHQSWQVANGALPYRNFFEFVTPVTMLFGGLFYKYFGFTVAGLRVLATILYLGNIWVADWIFKPYLKPWGRYFLILFFAGLVIPNTVGYSHHVWSGAFGTWAVGSLIAHYRSGKIGWMILSGTLAAFTVMSTQSLGTLIFIALWIAIIFNHWVFRKSSLQQFLSQAALPYGLGFTLVSLIFIGFLAFQGILDDAYRDTALWLLQGHYAKTTNFIYYMPGFKEIIGIVFGSLSPEMFSFRWLSIPVAGFLFSVGWLPVLGLLWGTEKLLRLLKKKESLGNTDRELLILVSAGIAIFISTWSYPTPWHIGMTNWLNYGLAFIVLQGLAQKLFPPVFRTIGISLVILITTYLIGLKSMALWGAYQIPEFWVASYGTTEKFLLDSQGPRSTQVMNQLVHRIRQDTKPNDPFYGFNVSPELYLLLDRPPATKFYTTLPVYTSKVQIQEIIEDLKKNQPPVVVYDRVDRQLITNDERFKGYKTEMKQLDPLRQYISKHYQGKTIGPYTIFKRL